MRNITEERSSPWSSWPAVTPEGSHLGLRWLLTSNRIHSTDTVSLGGGGGPRHSNTWRRTLVREPMNNRKPTQTQAVFMEERKVTFANVYRGHMSCLPHASRGHMSRPRIWGLSQAETATCPGLVTPPPGGQVMAPGAAPARGPPSAIGTLKAD